MAQFIKTSESDDKKRISFLNIDTGLVMEFDARDTATAKITITPQGEDRLRKIQSFTAAQKSLFDTALATISSLVPTPVTPKP